jgi:hypothetical protein
MVAPLGCVQAFLNERVVPEEAFAGDRYLCPVSRYVLPGVASGEDVRSSIHVRVSEPRVDSRRWLEEVLNVGGLGIELTSQHTW